MKNAELKEKYLRENYSSEPTIKSKQSILKVIGRFEDKYGKDLGLFTRDDVLRMIREAVKDNNFRTFEIKLSAARRYALWYREQMGLEETNAWDIRSKDLAEMFGVVKKPKIENADPLSYEDVVKAASTLKNPRDRALLLGIYEGIGGGDFQEFLEIKPEDVKEHSIYIRDRKRDIPVSDTLIGYFKDAMKERIYVTYHSMRQQKVLLTESDTMALKSTVAESRVRRPLVKVFKDIRGHLEESDRFKLNNIKLWGIANVLVEMAEKENVPVDEAYLLHSQELLDHFNRRMLNADTIIEAAKELQQYKEKTNG